MLVELHRLSAVEAGGKGQHLGDKTDKHEGGIDGQTEDAADDLWIPKPGPHSGVAYGLHAASVHITEQRVTSTAP